MKSLFFATTASIAFATGAMAGSPNPAPVTPAAVVAPAAASDWSGLYVGGLVSIESGDATALNNGSPVNFADMESTTAFGGFVGYNKQVNAMVFGGELAYTTGDVALVGYPNTIYTDRIDLKARAGYSFGRAMVYGVVGYSFADFDDVGTVHPSSGLNYGVGVDVMVGERFFVGAEYLMRDLSGEDGSLGTDGNLDSASIRAGIKF